MSERFSLGMNAEVIWSLNPLRRFTHILSRDSFERESQPTVESLEADRPGDVLCRLQMPVLSEYFVPNHRGWFALFDSRDESRGMLGVLGLYGARWEEPASNMPEVFVRGGTAEWHPSLASGTRHWLLYAGPVEKTFRGQGSEGSGRSLDAGDPTPDTRHLTPRPAEGRFVFHRLHAEFNALRLDEHLDLTGGRLFDETCWREPGLFVGEDFHEQARKRAEALPCLRRALEAPGEWMRHSGAMHLATFRALLDPTPPNHLALYDALVLRFERWVRQFQGWRRGQGDYMKNVIGFSRYLRGMLIAYELLRKDGALTDAQARRLNAYFVFAARRRLAGWLCRFFGPRDARFDAYTWPGVGNSRVPQGGGEALLAYAGELADGDLIQAFGVLVEGRGPWAYNMDGNGKAEARGGPPRLLTVAGPPAPAAVVPT